jgi:uncharacterized YccA/Bax inhibitor family protein
MQSKNPIFTRAEGFNSRGGAYGNTTYPGNGQQYAGYGAPSQWGTGTPGTTQVDQGRMTIDSVVQKTGITLGVVVLMAAATWYMTPEVTNDTAMSSLYSLALVGALGGFVLAMVNSFKKVVSPALVLAYAALEGIFMVRSARSSRPRSPLPRAVGADWSSERWSARWLRLPAPWPPTSSSTSRWAPSSACG